MKRIFLILMSAVFAALLLFQPARAAEAVRSGLQLCVETVVPSLFPFFVVTSLLMRLGADSLLRPLCANVMGPLFGLRGECAAPLLAGFLGGYPTGARAAAQLYEQGGISRGEAERLLGFCNNCGPGFLVGFVGAGVLGSVRAGIALLIVHAAAALISGMILCRLPGKRETAALPCRLPGECLSFPKALTASVSDALSSTMSVCAYVVFFRAAVSMAGAWMPEFVMGVLEMVGGAASLSGDGAGFVAAAAITAWGGVSVHCQTMSVVGDLSVRYHLMGKAMQAVIAALLAAGVCWI